MGVVARASGHTTSTPPHVHVPGEQCQSLDAQHGDHTASSASGASSVSGSGGLRSSLVMLLPPLKFAFKTTRAPGAQQSLVISGEFGALVWGSRVWHFVNPPGKEMPQETQALEAKEHNHKRGIYCALTKLAGQGHALPLGMLEADFLTAI